MMKSGPDISLLHMRIIKLILKKYLPNGTKVWIFGSRVKKTKKKYSDLDLAIDMNHQKLSIKLLSQLDHAFDESDLPYKVDIVDWNDLDNSFREMIQAVRIRLNWENDQGEDIII